jgi:hypothetical protein
MSEKANCYECVYRGEIPGDCHSRCNHPAVTQDSNEFGELTALIDLLHGKNGGAASTLHIQGNAHGIRHGWFCWPANFDPIWLDNCDGFTRPKTQQSTKTP